MKMHMIVDKRSNTPIAICEMINPLTDRLIILKYRPKKEILSKTSFNAHPICNRAWKGLPKWVKTCISKNNIEKRASRMIHDWYLEHAEYTTREREILNNIRSSYFLDPV